ncbi:hypothetical protein NDU88_007130 [Pleurodeles waltl]|uniref:Uncharacterized protein n=1 Tax=Pleurodeles waltl TaxID=8319 RepID=A0AAV7PNX7_PLEWA|nr:hypothetical protein NDU88_007130 [Pleurodeles waltl]
MPSERILLGYVNGHKESEGEVSLVKVGFYRVTRPFIALFHFCRRVAAFFQFSAALLARVPFLVPAFQTAVSEQRGFILCQRDSETAV